MNKRQKEIVGNRLVTDERVLSELKRTYEQARRSIDDKIASLLAREDTENLQSIIYQVDYQNALKSQINAILEDLNTKQFDTISKYLTDSYEDGFIGTLYDLQGQGVPLIFPIDQESVVRTLKHDTKLSESLYTSLGKNVSDMQKKIRNEVSRGITQGYSYEQIAKNIATQTNIGYNKSARIARTESQRIANEAALEAQHKAKDAGADIVKQWDATLDKNTRNSHRMLDGQIRELDEPFEVNGYKAQGPGQFGVASMDINCRCSILQRAKWALDEDELEEQQQRAKFFGLDKADRLDKYKDIFNRLSIFTNEETRALSNYSGIFHRNVNAYMNGLTNKISSHDENLIDNLHNAIERVTIPEDMTVWRGSDLGIFGKYKNKVAEDIKSAIGMKVTNKGFMSTTTRQRTAGMFSGSLNDKTIFYELDVPKGAKGIIMGNYSSQDHEDEILLQDHTTVDIYDVIETIDKIIFKGRIVT